MAEGWTQYLKGDQIAVYSAGIKTHELDPLAVKAMNESGVDISTYKSKNVSSLMHIRLDYVITVCDHAYENCPIFPGHAKVLHAGFDDPPGWRRMQERKKRLWYSIAGFAMRYMNMSKTFREHCWKKRIINQEQR